MGEVNPAKQQEQQEQHLKQQKQSNLPTGRANDGLHGGDLQAASAAYGKPVSEWLDLSTGMNPCPWPVPLVPQSAFERLPYEDPAFTEAAVDYYGVSGGIAVAGSQMAIECLPSLLPRLPVLVPSVGYQEHRVSWAAHGNELLFYPSMDAELAAAAIDLALARNTSQHLLVINPNNPTGIMFGVEQLLSWASLLSAGGYLVVDEAFIDLDPMQSLLSHPSTALAWPENVIVLRSFGKFFGLAGIRLGFVFASPKLADVLKARLGLWAVNGPAQWVAQCAFADIGWQYQQRQRLPIESRRQCELFEPLLALTDVTVTRQAEQPLFHSYLMPSRFALKLQDFFAAQAILMRVVKVDADNSLLRVGLMPNCVQQQRRVRDTLAAFIGVLR